MAAEIERIAHFYGEGLPTPVEVLRAELGEKGVVYFLSQYDREAPQQTPSIAATTADSTPASFLNHARYEGDRASSSMYEGMLAHAAIYGPGFAADEKTKTEIQRWGIFYNFDRSLRLNQVYRARYLPDIDAEE
jgi:hypothetical protein